MLCVILRKTNNNFMKFVKLALSLSRRIANKTVNDMKKSTQKSIRTLTLATLILGGLLLVFTYWQMFALIWSDHYFARIVWMEGYKGWQIAVIVGRLLTLTLIYVFCWLFLRRINRGMETGELFPKSNIALLRWSALLMVFFSFFWTNIGNVLHGESTIQVDSNIIVLPLMAMIFAQLYKVAYLAAKDSNLAI